MTVFDQEWFVKYQKQLLFLANTKYGRKVLCIDGEASSVGNNKIVGILPNAIFWKNDNQITGEFRTQDKFSRRLYYSYKPIWHAFHNWDMVFANNVCPALNLGFDTTGDLFPSAGAVSPCDGPVNRVSVDEAFATIVAAAGNQGGLTAVATDQFAGIKGSTTSNQYAELHRAIFNFDTSSIGSGSTISAGVNTWAIVGTFQNSALGSNQFDLTSATPAATNAIPAGDFVNIGSTSFGNVTNAGFNNAGYNSITLNTSGDSNISKTGISSFGTKIGWDINSSFGGAWVSAATTRFEGKFADTAATTSDPKLNVTFTTGAGATATYGVLSMMGVG
jgi:hypothetical protein